MFIYAFIIVIFAQDVFAWMHPACEQQGQVPISLEDYYRAKGSANCSVVASNIDDLKKIGLSMQIQQFETQLKSRVKNLVTAKIWEIELTQACLTKNQSWADSKKINRDQFFSHCRRRENDLRESIKERWSAMREHLTLSVRPIAKGLGLVETSLKDRFELERVFEDARRHPIGKFARMEPLDSEAKNSILNKMEAEIKSCKKTITLKRAKDYYWQNRCENREDQRKAHKLEYQKIMSQNPVLGYIEKSNPSGQELQDALEKMKKSLVQEADKLKDADMDRFLQYGPIVNSLLEENPKLCGIAETASKELESRKNNQDMALFGVGLVAMVPCFMGGALSMAMCVGSGLALSGVTTYQAAQASDMSLTKYLAGVDDLNKLEDAQKDLMLQKFFLGLTVAGSAGGAIKGVKALAARKGSELESVPKVIPERMSVSRKTRTENSRVREGEQLESELLALAQREGPGMIARDQYIASHGTRNFATKEQNMKFQKVAESTRRGEGVQFFDVENSVMKMLNDEMKNKDLVTAMTNRHKDLLIDALDRLRQTNPGLMIDHYSDFKSTRFALSGKVPNDLRQQLTKAFGEVNEKFKDELHAHKIVRDHDRPDLWFRGGICDHADMANLATRYGRAGHGASNRNAIRGCADADFIENVETSLAFAKNFRKEFTTKVKGTPLLVSQRGHEGLSAEAFDIIKKYKEPKDIQEVFKKRYGVNLDSETVTNLREYALLVDEFSPPNYIPQREIVNFDKGVNGAISTDFAGMGSLNGAESGLAVNLGKSLDEVTLLARQGEKRVTEKFVEARRLMQENISKALSGQKGLRVETRCSGDDCVSIPSRALTREEKSLVLKVVAENGNPSSYRMAFVPDAIVDSNQRSQIATHGESVEKLLRKKLDGVVPFEKLKSTLFAVDVDTTKAFSGKMSLLWSTKGKVKFTESEMDEIQKVFKDSVEQLNKELKKEKHPSAYLGI